MITTGVMISTGMVCVFEVRYRILLQSGTQLAKSSRANCTIKSEETKGNKQ